MNTKLPRRARKMGVLVAIFAVVLPLVSVNAAPANHRLTGDTAYEFVGGEGYTSGKGLLVWEGSITGDFNGCIQWWSPAPLTVTGQASHYDENWEIWAECPGHVGVNLLLEGADRGATTARHLKNSIWRANGIVTGPADSELVGRRMHSGGTVEWLFINGVPVPESGVGVFRVN